MSFGESLGEDVTEPTDVVTLLHEVFVSNGENFVKTILFSVTMFFTFTKLNLVITISFFSLLIAGKFRSFVYRYDGKISTL